MLLGAQKGDMAGLEAKGVTGNVTKGGVPRLECNTRVVTYECHTFFTKKTLFFVFSTIFLQNGQKISHKTCRFRSYLTSLKSARISEKFATETT